MKSTRLKILLELLLWLITALILYAVLFPIYQYIDSYDFLYANSLFVVVFVTLTRYVFLLKYTWLARLQWIKVVFFFLCIPLVFHLIHQLNMFQTYLDETGLETMFKDYSLEVVNNMTRYIRSEMIFFGTGSIIISIIFAFRMIVSIWRLRNRGTV